jgi:hypothetical protein
MVDNYLNVAVTSSAGAANYCYLTQEIFNPSEFTNGYITVSGIVKNSSGSAQTMLVTAHRYYGPAGSTQVDYNLGQVSVGTGWTYFALSILIAADAAATINSPNHLGIRFWMDAGASTYGTEIGQKSVTWQFGGLKMERGQSPTVDLPQPLALSTIRCQTFYQRCYMVYSGNVTSGQAYVVARETPINMTAGGAWAGWAAPTVSESTAAQTSFPVSGTNTFTAANSVVSTQRTASASAYGTYSTTVIIDYGY